MPWRWPRTPSPLNWDGNRLFQAAKFVTEMQYQHLVFEEFARKIQPAVDFFDDYDATLNPASSPSSRTPFTASAIRC